MNERNNGSRDTPAEAVTTATAACDSTPAHPFMLSDSFLIRLSTAVLFQTILNRFRAAGSIKQDTSSVGAKGIAFGKLFPPIRVSKTASSPQSDFQSSPHAATFIILQSFLYNLAVELQRKRLLTSIDLRRSFYTNILMHDGQKPSIRWRLINLIVTKWI